jgi:hypothetical protein
MYVGAMYSNEAINDLHQVWASYLWITRGAIDDYDESRKKKDYLDARRIVASILANSIFEGNRKGIAPPVPKYYFDYLSSLSISEFKRIKAYNIWEMHGKVINDDVERIVGDYYTACSYLPCNEYWQHDFDSYDVTMWLNDNRSITEYLEKVIMSSKTGKNQIVNRRAYWAGLEGNSNEKDNYERASSYVDRFYQGAITALGSDYCNSDKEDELLSMLEGNHDIASTFEKYVALRIPHVAVTSSI